MQMREINPADDIAELAAIYALRLAAWAPQVPVPLVVEDVIDEFESAARHWAIFDGEVLAAAARLSIHEHLADVPEACCLSGVFAEAPPAPIGFLSRLVVADAYRRCGLSRELDEIRIAAAEQAGCRSLLALVYDVSGESRVRQLQSLGFTVKGRGLRDTHPKFRELAEPLVLMRIAVFRVV